MSSRRHAALGSLLAAQHRGSAVTAIARSAVLGVRAVIAPIALSVADAAAGVANMPPA
jgi:hypothetical protein